MIEIRLDETQFTNALQGVRECVKLGLVDPEHGTLPKQAQMLVELCMVLTPPRNNKDASGKRITNSHKEAGESAVARDINRVIKARNPAYLESVIAITGKEDNIRQVLRTKKGVTYLIDVDRINVDGSEQAAWHAKHRDSRGRISRSTSTSNDTVIGRWQADNRLWVPPGSLSAYVKKMKARVGWAKAGWMKAYLGLKGKRVADWVARHGTARGQFENGLSSSRPYIAVYNDTGWGRSGEAQRIVSAAFAARTKAMITYANTAMRLAGEGKPTRWQAKMAAESARTEL